MNKKRPVSAYFFTVWIAAAAAIVAYQGLYHLKTYSGNSAYLVDLLRGRDLFTLYIGIPLLLIAGVLALRRSNRAYLAWLGMLCYFMTTYLWYACGIAYNQFFIIYLLLFTSAIFSLIRALLALDAEIFCLRFSPNTPIRYSAIFMFGGGLALAYQWIHPILPAISVGSQPDLLQLYGSTTMINLVLNLGIISPLAIITSFWIWRRKPWGYITNSILLSYGLTTNMAFLATQWIIHNRGEVIVWRERMAYVGVTFIILILWGIFLKSLREEIIQDHHSRLSSVF
jgi:hypothetical protein